MSGRQRGQTTMRHCGNYGKPGYTARIYKEDEGMSNAYSSVDFKLIAGVVVD